MSNKTEPSLETGGILDPHTEADILRSKVAHIILNEDCALYSTPEYQALASILSDAAASIDAMLEKHDDMDANDYEAAGRGIHFK